MPLCGVGDACLYKRARPLPAPCIQLYRSREVQAIKISAAKPLTYISKMAKLS